MRSLYIKPLTMEPLWAYCSLQICERWQWDIEGGEIMQETRIRFSARVDHMPRITKDHCQVAKPPAVDFIILFHARKYNNYLQSA